MAKKTTFYERISKISLLLVMNWPKVNSRLANSKYTKINTPTLCNHCTLLAIDEFFPVPIFRDLKKKNFHGITMFQKIQFKCPNMLKNANFLIESGYKRPW